MHVDTSRYYFQVGLKLFPKDGSQPGLPLPTPTMARGLLFQMLSAVNPTLVEQLHAPEQVRPYSIQRRVEWAEPPRISARGQGRGDDRRPRRLFQSVTFLVNIFREDVLRAFQQYLLQLQDIEVPLGEYPYLTGEVSIHRKSFLDLFPPRVNVTVEHSAVAEPQDCEELNSASPNHCDEAYSLNLPRSYRVTFVTPTFFSTSRGQYPLRLPTPDALAGNLARLWNAFQVGVAEVELQDFLDWINRGVVATSFDLKTRPWPLSKPRQVIGVKGWAVYQVWERNPAFETWLYTLLHLGEITNVGRSRTAGAGQIRVQ